MQRAARTALVVGLALLALVPLLGEGAAAASPGAPPPGPPAGTAPAPMSLDTGNATRLYPNQSVSGGVGPTTTRLFSVWANRSLAAPEVLLITLEASGSGFSVGYARIYDPYQVPMRDLFTNYDGQQVSQSLLVGESGFYLIEVGANAGYLWSLTVNWTSGTASPADNDNDLANATFLGSASNATTDWVTDWQDLYDLYAFNLTTRGARADALLVNLSALLSVDIDLWLYHIQGGVAVIDAVSDSPTGQEYLGYYPAVSGTYYLRVSSYSGTTPYGLVWQVRDEAADANNNPALATPPPQGLTLNNLSRWDTRDVFLLNVAANTTVNVTTHTLGFDAVNRTPNLQAVLWDSSFSRVTWSFLFDPDERIDALLVLPGVYYLDIFPASVSYFLTTALSFDYTLNVTVDPPPALADPLWNFTMDEDEVRAVDLWNVVPRDPAGEALAFDVMGTSGSIDASIGADGHTLTIAPAADWSGAGSVSVRATDRWTSATFVLPIAVLPVNDAPRRLANPTPVSFNEDTAQQAALSLLFFDPEGDAFTALSASAQAPLNATFDGTSLWFEGPPDFWGNRTAWVVLEDALGATANISVSVSILPVNDAPRFVGSFGPLDLQEDAGASQATFPLAGHVLDPDGDPVQLEVSTAPELTGLIVNNTLTLLPAADFNGNVAITLTASDGSLMASMLVQVRVAAVNDPPTLQLTADQRLGREGAAFHLDVPAVDIDTPSADLRYSFLLDGVPLVNDSANASFDTDFGFESAGFHILRVVVSDGALSSATDVPIFVAAVNRPPEGSILTPTERTLKASEVVAFLARGVDPDGDTLSYRWILDGSLASNSPSFSVEHLAPGKHRVELYVSDGELESKAATDFEVTGSLPGPAALAVACALMGAALVSRLARRR